MHAGVFPEEPVVSLKIRPMKRRLHSSPIRLSKLELRSVLLSHGWYALAPFRIRPDLPEAVLTRMSGNRPVVAQVRVEGGRTVLRALMGPLKSALGLARTALSLDEPWHGALPRRLCQGRFEWIARHRLGRFLRSPSLYEDVCKAILCTNTTWSRTVFMAREIVRLAGQRRGEYEFFPAPRRLAAALESSLPARKPFGYRWKSLLAAARAAMAAPGLFLGDGWKQLSNADFSSAVSGVRGIGPVSADYLCRIYSKPSGFGEDAYVRRRMKMMGIGREQLKPLKRLVVS